MSNSTLNVCISQDSSEHDMNIKVLYTKLLKRYNKIQKKMSQLQEDKELIIENVIFYFIKMAIEEDREVDEDIIFHFMINEYKVRFFSNQETKEEAGWHGKYQFNYGDLVYDTNESEKCIVLGENKQEVSLWYFNKKTCTEIVCNKPKNSMLFTVLKRCNIDAECKDIN